MHIILTKYCSIYIKALKSIRTTLFIPLCENNLEILLTHLFYIG